MLYSSIQLNNEGMFNNLPIVDDGDCIPNLIPCPGNDDECFLPTELGRNSSSSPLELFNLRNEGTLLSSAVKAYNMKQ